MAHVCNHRVKCGHCLYMPRIWQRWILIGNDLLYSFIKPGWCYVLSFSIFRRGSEIEPSCVPFICTRKSPLYKEYARMMDGSSRRISANIPHEKGHPAAPKNHHHGWFPLTSALAWYLIYKLFFSSMKYLSKIFALCNGLSQNFASSCILTVIVRLSNFSPTKSKI